MHIGRKNPTTSPTIKLTYYLNSPYGRLRIDDHTSLLNGRDGTIQGDSRRRGMVRVKFREVNGIHDVPGHWLSLERPERPKVAPAWRLNG